MSSPYAYMGPHSNLDNRQLGTILSFYLFQSFSQKNWRVREPFDQNWRVRPNPSNSYQRSPWYDDPGRSPLSFKVLQYVLQLGRKCNTDCAEMISDLYIHLLFWNENCYQRKKARKKFDKTHKLNELFNREETCNTLLPWNDMTGIQQSVIFCVPLLL